LEYRPDIDGLRAVAVLAVVTFHAFPGRMPGGFIGVDIFFVISGYLISRIIFQKLHEGRFGFLEFYAHRVRRIFPALIVVLAFSGVAGWFLLLPREYEQLGKHILAGAGFAENFLLRQEAGYFDVASEYKPLMHLWSLSIEEQFYLLYPLLLWGLWRWGLNFFTILLLLFLFSFGCNASGVATSPEHVFLSPQSRFWELWAGSLLAYLDLFYRRAVFHSLGKHGLLSSFFYAHRPERVVLQRQETILGNILSFAGFLLIVASLFVLRKEHPFPGWWALLPVMGAFLMILAGQKGWINQNLLCRKSVLFIGRISYPLYLWHWPLLSFSRIVVEEEPPFMMIMVLVGSVILAWLTWRYLEKPIRFGRKTKTRMALLIGGMIALAGVGFHICWQEGFEMRLEESIVQVARADREWEFPGEMRKKEFLGISYYVFPSKRRAVTLFMGDSNAEQYFSRVDELIRNDPEHTNSAMFKTGSACLPIMNMNYGKAHSHCNTLAADALKLVQNLPEVESVVLAAIWAEYLSGGTETTKNIAVGNPEYQDTLRRLSIYLKTLVAMKKKVWLVLTIPTGMKLSPTYMAERPWKNFLHQFRLPKGGIEKAQLDSRYRRIHADLTRIAQEAGATVIDPTQFLCDAKRCEALDEKGEPMYRDADHLRPVFVRHQATFMDQTLR
jgi:peptidoglycan/LPS O-acetylase OafA/YrhL